MASTIKDVARVAGVSPSTVSRVLAGNPRISPETHEKVRAVMDELRYYPHAIARSLVTKSSKTIGLVTSRPASQAFANPFFAEVIRGIGSVLENEGYNLLLYTGHGERKEREACLEMLRSRHVDGVILTISRRGDQLIESLVNEQQHFVLIGRPSDGDGRLNSPGASWVNNDNVAAAGVAVEHLLSLGHRRIACVAGPQEWVFCFDRLLGYQQALERAGIPLDPALVLTGAATREDGQQALARLMALPEPPTAIVAVDDSVALGVMEAALRRGVRVPADLALVGFNDDPIANWTRPSLTTVRIPVFDLGMMAARTLLGRLQSPFPGGNQIVLPSQLVVRESTAG